MKRPVPLAALALIAIVGGALVLLIGLAMRGGASEFNSDSVTLVGVLVLVAGIQMWRLKRSGGPIMGMATVVAAVASLAAGQADRDYMAIVMLGFWGGLYQKWLGEHAARARAAAGQTPAPAPESDAPRDVETMGR
jgi:hypothetical protein